MTSQENFFYPTEQWSTWFDELATNDYLVVDNFIYDSLYNKIQSYFKELLNEQEFSKAGIGSANQHKIEASVRGDFIYWLDKNTDSEISFLFNLFDEVLQNLRQHLFLSLSDYEFHFALYPPKNRYEKHIDQFYGKTNRVISMLIYLNDEWKPGDGGELKIYQPNSTDYQIEPIGNRLVMFKSDSVEHEVLLTHTSRKSVTGWLLHQPATLGNFI